jgi:hypothetical protein
MLSTLEYQNARNYTFSKNDLHGSAYLDPNIDV